MTCHLQDYRMKIGTFQNRSPFLNRNLRKFGYPQKTNVRLKITSFILVLMVLFHCSMVSSCPYVLNTMNRNPAMQQADIPGNTTALSWAWQGIYPHPGSGTLAWMAKKDRNRVAHTTNGNRGQRGKGVTCLYWNKGPSLLANKMIDIESIIDDHKPHIFGLGEANHRHDHDIQAVQIPGYNLHIDSSINNTDLGLARVVVYTHNSLRVKRREDLEDDVVAAVWLECGLPNHRSFLVCMGYRQWRLVGQPDNSLASIPSQLAC